MFCSLLYLCFYSSLFFQFKNILPKDIFWNSCQIINRDSTSDIKWELVLHFNTKTHKSLLSLRISTDCLLNFHRDTSPNRYKSQVKKKILGEKTHKEGQPLSYFTTSTTSTDYNVCFFYSMADLKHSSGK